MPLYKLSIGYEWSIEMYSFEQLKRALKKREEEAFEALKKEIRQLRDNIEKILTKILESSASKARSNYSGLEMY